MKISVLLLMTCTLQVSSSVYAQLTKFNLNIDNLPIREVLREIESKSDFRFFYSENLMLLDEKVQMAVEDMNVEQVLDKLLAGTQYSYKVMDNNLVIIAPDYIVAKQQQKITGSVTDATTGEPLPGVYITIEGTNSGAVTDATGKYSLEVPAAGTVIVFSFVGYVTEKVTVNNQAVIDMKLSPDITALEEVVVVGYGKTQKKEELTGAIAVVKATILADKVSSSATNMLQGTAAGLTVNQDVSYPGMVGSIKVRNVSSWQGSSEPLFVIDGVISTSSDFNRLSSADIDNISVLKDAASAAIYGMRAGNGVILVTTKQGSTSKTQMTYQTSYSMQSPTNWTKRVKDAYTACLLNNMTYKNFGASDSDPGVYTQDELDYFKTHSFDRVEAIKGTPTLKNHTLSVSGGTGDTKYYISGSAFDQAGFTKNYNFSKYSLLAKLSGKINNNISFSLNLNMGWNKTKQPYVGYENASQGILAGWSIATPLMQPTYINGKVVNNSQENMVLVANGDAGFNNSKSNMIKPVFQIKYQVPFIKGLSLTGIGSYKNTYDYSKTFVTVPYGYAFKMTGGHNHIYSDEIDTSQGNNGLLPISQIQASIDGAENKLTINTARYQSYDLQWIADYERTFGKHNLSALAGYELWATSGDYLNAWGKNYTNTNFQEIDGADPDVKYRQPSGNQTNLSGQASYFGRLDYNYDMKYIIGFTFRADGTYIFPPDHRWGYFPAGSAAWNISKEEFFEPLKSYISEMKLRASYGLTGSSATDPWQWQQSYAYYSSIDYILDGESSSGSGLGGVVNPDITWEKNKNIDLGADITLFKGLGTLSFDYWHKKTTDILAARTASTPNTVGASLPAVNYGEAAARGFEFSVGHNNTIGEFKYGVSGNISFSTNEYLKIDQANTVRDYQNVIGRSIDGRIEGYHCEGIIRTQADVDRILAEHGSDFTIFGYKPQPGMLMYSDVRGALGIDSPDGKVDSYDTDLLTENGTPRITYGFNVNCSWKGFALNLDFAGFARYKGMVDQYHGRKPYAMWGIWYDMWENFWTADNPDAPMPDPCWHDWIKGYNIDASSTFWLKNRSFLRLKNANLSYTIPNKLLDKVKLKGATVYVAGENLLTFSNYYIDPEQGGMRMLPVLKSFTLGAKITF